MLLIERIVVGPLMSNVYLVFDSVAKEGVLIDAGDDPDRIIKIIGKNNVKVKRVYVTHGHFDHILAIRELQDYLECKFYIHRDDLPILEKAAESCNEE